MELLIAIGIALAGWFAWNVLLWGLAHNEADEANKPFNWKKYRKTHIDDAVVTLVVGVPLVVWQSVWLWEILVNTIPKYFFTYEPFEYSSFSLACAGPVCQALYYGAKKARKFTNRLKNTAK